jgi:uncharacterized membrane-anchored protein YjiN (DUF445 family)
MTSFFTEEDEDEDDEYDESEHENEEQSEVQAGNTSGPINVIESSPHQHQILHQQNFQQSTVHKVKQVNKTNKIQSSLETQQQASEEQTPQLSTIHKVKSVNKVENKVQNSSKTPEHQTPRQSTVNKGKKLDDVKTDTKKPKKADNIKNVVKATHYKTRTNKYAHANLKQHLVEHKKTKKGKSFLKYIHRPKLHNHLREAAKVSK